MLQPIISALAEQHLAKTAESTEADQPQTPTDARDVEHQNEPLYARLQSFAFDKPGTSLSFSARLARNCMWTPECAYRVCEEYRRFLYLICITDQTLTPPGDVDEAWHLHLTYTESYWNDLCADTLSRALHHSPSEGGEEQYLHYRDCYNQALRLYEKVFDERPPADIWPDIDARFRNADAMRIVDTSRYWLIRKLPTWVFTPVAMYSGIALTVFGANGVGSEIYASVPSALFAVGAGSVIWSLFNAHNSWISVGTEGSGFAGCGGWRVRRLTHLTTRKVFCYSDPGPA